MQTKLNNSSKQTLLSVVKHTMIIIFRMKWNEMKFFTSGNEMESIANFKANRTMWPNEESILIVIGNVSERKCRERVAQSRRFLGRFQQPSGSPWHRHNHWREHDNSGFFSLHHRHRSAKLSYSTFNMRGSKICCTVDFIIDYVYL